MIVYYFQIGASYDVTDKVFKWSNGNPLFRNNKNNFYNGLAGWNKIILNTSLCLLVRDYNDEYAFDSSECDRKNSPTICEFNKDPTKTTATKNFNSCNQYLNLHYGNQSFSKCYNFDDLCYYTSRDKMTREVANDMCYNMSGSLAYINSQLKFNFFTNLNKNSEDVEGWVSARNNI